MGTQTTDSTLGLTRHQHAFTLTVSERPVLTKRKAVCQVLSRVENRMTTNAATWCHVGKLDTPYQSLE